MVTRSRPTRSQRPARKTAKKQAASPRATARTSRTAAKAQGTREDGRRLRAARNREAVVEAVLAIIRGHGPGGGPLPGAAEVAKRAGVSERTVFRHFADLDALFLAAAARMRPIHVTYLTPRPDAKDVNARIAELVRLRSKLYEEIAPVRRVANRLAVNQPVLREQVNQTLVAARQQATDTFAPELQKVDARRRAIVVDAIDIASGWTTWNELRSTNAASVERTKRVVTELLTDILEPLAKKRR